MQCPRNLKETSKSKDKKNETENIQKKPMNSKRRFASLQKNFFVHALRGSKNLTLNSHQ